ncbi:MAG TPA: hypothetical protein VFZ91_04815 [Allosphingosinicella sp.]
MRMTAAAIALLLGGAAVAQTDTFAGDAYEGDGVATTAFETEASFGLPAAAGGQVVQPGNSAPERDARGIAVISDPAIAPPGWNGVPATAAMGGPELDAVTGQPLAPRDYPACTASVTDRCLQTYEKGRH